MKKVMKWVLIVILAGGTSLFIGSFITKNNTSLWAYTIDMVNPFVGYSEVYVKAPQEPSSSWEDAANGKTDYGYEVQSVDEKGNRRKIAITSFGGKFELSPDKYLIVSIKGQNIKGYAEISVEQIPEKALEGLEE